MSAWTPDDRLRFAGPLLERAGIEIERLFDGLVERSPRPRLLTRFLGGDWLDHPLHPLLVDLAGGFWTTTLTFDVLARLGLRSLNRPADVTLGLGLVSALPAVLAGANDWRALRGRPREIGVAHALLNASATSGYAVSFLLRLVGARDAARKVAALASAVVVAGAYLGGHLVYREGAGVRTPAVTGIDCAMCDVLAAPAGPTVP
jgi:uncharacterized membrane protein